jgi:hypothetical protein
VSLPIFSFFIMRWLWRILLWWRFLWRVSRLDLKLIATHPDRAAGLGFLGYVHMAFGAFLVPVAASVAARGVQWVQWGGGTLTSLRNALIAFGVIALAIVLAPLLAFVPKLLATKREGLLDYSKLGTDYTRGFDQKWVRDARSTDEPLLGTADLQSLADLANSFQVIQGMRVVPILRENLIALVAAIALPMLPFLFVVLPLEQMLKQVASLVMK